MFFLLRSHNYQNSKFPDEEFFLFQDILTKREHGFVYEKANRCLSILTTMQERINTITKVILMNKSYLECH